MIEDLKVLVGATSPAIPSVVALWVCSRITKRPIFVSAFDSIGVGMTAEVMMQLVSMALAGFGWAEGEFLELHARTLGGVIAGLMTAAFLLLKDWRRRQARTRESFSRSVPMLWHQVFRDEKQHVILHLRDGRQIFGWPEGWPGDASKGHFFLIEPRWRKQGLPLVSDMDAAAALIPAADVAFVHFVDATAALHWRAQCAPSGTSKLAY